MNKIGSAGKIWIMPNLNRPVSLGLNQLMIRLKELNTMLKRQEENKSTGIIKIEIISFDKVYHFLKESDIDNNLIQFLDEKLLEYKDNLELELNNLKKQLEDLQ